MFIAETFDPSSALSGTFNTRLPINGRFVMLNESNIGITLTFSDASQAYCPAWTGCVFQLPTATPNVSWQQKNVLVSASAPISECAIISYLPSEQIVGTYPVALNRQFNMGNAVPLSTSATSIVNSGNASGTPIVQGQVSGDGGNAIQITNDGQVTVGDGLHAGNITVTGGAVSTPTVNANTTNSTNINTDTINVNTALNLITGSLTRLYFFTGGGTQTFTHNFGVVPSCVLINYAGNFGSPPTQAIAWFSVNSNTITVVGEGGYSYQGVVIRS